MRRELRDRFDVAATKWYESAQAIWRPWPDQLFHYTSGAGFHGILQSGELWGGHYSFMNDRSEFDYGIGLFHDIVRQTIRSTTSHSGRKLLELLLDSDLIAPDDLYIACFCEDADLLSQWRGYGTQSTRYCVHFGGDSIDDFMTEDCSPPFPVTYDVDKQREVMRSLLETHLDTLASDRRRKRDLIEVGAMSIYTSALPFLATFKNPTFREEKEWRHIHVVSTRTADNVGQLRFVNSDGVMRPMVPLLSAGEAKRLPIVEVIASGTHDSHRAARSARLMLDRYGYADVPVRVSAVPLAL